LGPPRPLFTDLALGRPAAAAASVLLPPLALFPADRPQPPRRLFDFGREVTGYLLVDVQPAAEQDGKQIGLLWTGGAPPDPLHQRESAGIIVLPGRRTWMDARPRRFRYALVMGLPRTLGARVQEVDPGRAAVLLAPLGSTVPRRGVLGIVPPPLRTPVEDEIWRQLKRAPQRPRDTAPNPGCPSLSQFPPRSPAAPARTGAPRVSVTDPSLDVSDLSARASRHKK